MLGQIILFFSITFNPENGDNIYLRNTYICLLNSVSHMPEDCNWADIQRLVKQRCLCVIGKAWKEIVQTGLNWSILQSYDNVSAWRGLNPKPLKYEPDVLPIWPSSLISDIRCR